MSRPTINHLLNDRFTHKRAEKVSNGKGGFTDNFDVDPIATNLPGRLNQVEMKDIERAEQQKAKVDHVIYFAPDTVDVRVNDRFLIRGRTFRVTVPRIEPSIRVYHKVGVEEIQGG